MIFSEELHQKLQELKTAADPADKARIVKECIALYRTLMRQPNPHTGGNEMRAKEMNRAQRKGAEKYLQKENQKFPEFLVPIPKEEWPVVISGLWQVWRSRSFLVQLYASAYGGVIRMSVNRTSLTKGGHWPDQITWEQLQKLKRECGYADFDAVEVYPSDRDVVNVTNMRHLWILEQPLAFAWRESATVEARK